MNDITSRMLNDKLDLGPMQLHAMVDWMLRQIADNGHGCLTGDCPHNRRQDCVASLVQGFLDDPYNQ